MMKKYLLLSAAFVAALNGFAQTPAKKASLGEDGRLILHDIVIDNSMLQSSREITSLDGFPFGKPCNPTFKNTRGATLADVNNDGVDEILFGADKTFYCLNGSGEVLWEREMEGINILPPTVGDMDGDGNMEVAVNNAGLAALGAAGRVYLLNGADGTDLDGWPLNFDDHWMINAPVMADVDGDDIMEIVSGERVGSSEGYVHVVNMAGEALEGWPVQVGATVAFTPSVGDINGDGEMNVIVGLSVDGSLWAFDSEGNTLDGFPQIATDGKLSYQSPILADITGDDNLEIIGSRHGDGAEYYAVDKDGNYVDGWPIAAAGWTYSPSSVADTDHDGNYEIFMGNPNTDNSEEPQPLDVIFGFSPDGMDLPNFPISKVGGNEGVITIADIDNNGVVDIIFTSNIFTLEDGQGFVHAYAMDGSGELDGFPLRTPALTFLNSAILGDIDNDGSLDLTTMSSRATFGAGVDSMYISAFDLDFPYMPENIYFNAYKGSNVRDGVVASLSTGIVEHNVSPLELYPNPVTNGVVSISIPQLTEATEMRIVDIQGRTIFTEKVSAGQANRKTIETTNFNSGVYFVHIKVQNQTYVGKLVID